MVSPFMGAIDRSGFALPMVFWVTGRIAREDRLKYLGLLILGGSQGFMGWFMVQSGLVDRPSVSHFRLAAIFSLALIIYCALLWMAFRLRFSGFVSIPPLFLPPACPNNFGMRVCYNYLGAFVAGLDAGMIYNSFPMMGIGFVPELGTLLSL